MKLDVAAILIKKAALEFDKKANAVLEDYGRAISQYKVLKYLYSECDSGVKLVDLERYYSMTHPTAIGLVRALEEKGFIEYRDNLHHKRNRLIFPTAKALAGRNLKKSSPCLNRSLLPAFLTAKEKN